MFGTSSLIFRPRSCTRWLKVKMTQWQSFEKCCTKARLDSFRYVKVIGRDFSWACAIWLYILSLQSSQVFNVCLPFEDNFFSFFRSLRVLPQLSNRWLCLIFRVLYSAASLKYRSSRGWYDRRNATLLMPSDVCSLWRLQHMRENSRKTPLGNITR